MHQTTVRFGPDLWRALEEEATRAGVSVAQFVRDAALARIAYTQGRRGDADFDAAIEDAVQGSTIEQAAENARRRARETIEATTALESQGRNARRRAKELREAAERGRSDRSRGVP